MTLREAADLLAKRALESPDLTLDYGNHEGYSDRYDICIVSSRYETDGDGATARERGED